MTEPAGEVLLYVRDDGAPAIEVQLEGESLWLSQQQIADLFQTTRENVRRHLRNIYAEGELTDAATSKESLEVRDEGERRVRRAITYYNLDAIISVGYRVKSRLATQFRIWATERLREYLIKGFTMDDARLKELGGGIYWRELLDRIRDIRSSEKVLYRQLLDLYATSVDYNPDAPETRRFFQEVQNKLHFGAHGHTAPAVILERADSSRPSMGLTSFKGSRPVKADVGVAKNYLNEFELGQLNTLVSAYFDAAEFRAQRHVPTYMSDWIAHLDTMLTAMGAPVLDGHGTVSRKDAEAHAGREYDAYRAQLREVPSEVERAYLDSLKTTQHRLEGHP